MDISSINCSSNSVTLMVWNPMAHGTKLYWYSGEPHDVEIPEMKWTTDWSNLEAEPPRVGIIGYNEYKIKIYCRWSWAT